MFYVKCDGKETGPMTGKQLKYRASQGKIDNTVLVRKENSDKWYPANKVKGLLANNTFDLKDLKCHYCDKLVKRSSKKCKYCGENLEITLEEVFNINNPTTCTDISQTINIPIEHELDYEGDPIAVWLSLIPGMGHIYTGKVLYGVIWFILTICGYYWWSIVGAILHMLCVIDAGFGNPFRKIK